MNQSLSEHYLSRKITINDAMAYSQNTQELTEMLSRQQTPSFA